MYAIVFLLIFAVVVVAYGLLIYKTGDINLLPYRAQHSIGGKKDVKYVGLVTLRVGLVLGAILTVALAIMHVWG